ncbi:MAG TPA: dUTP diphosphatase [Dehalococcoidia bacterium]|nr:dUTP diphosphatase [Dehalococcoidia bacterium]
MPVEIKVKLLRPGARLPRRATPGASGYDLHACLDAGGFLDLGPDVTLVPTGIAVEAPPGYDLQVRPRSGLGREGVNVVFGTIDSDYRGEVLVSMYTFGSRRDYRVYDGDRIAQLVVVRLAEADLVEVADLTPSQREGRGHGSTGR